jgi:hypothetical protein
MMKRFAVLVTAAVFAFGTMARPPEAEARRGGALVAGIIAGAVIGGIIAANVRNKRRHHYSYNYYPRRTYYPAYSYAPAYVYRRPVYRPVYAYRRPVYRPVYVYRSRPVYRAGFSRGRGIRGRRWR